MPNTREQMIESVARASQTYEVVGIAFPESCCTIWRVMSGHTVFGGDYDSTEDAAAACHRLNAIAVLDAISPPLKEIEEALEPFAKESSRVAGTGLSISDFERADRVYAMLKEVGNGK